MTGRCRSSPSSIGATSPHRRPGRRPQVEVVSIPAPTVALVTSSIRMNRPVTRLRRVGVDEQRLVVRSCTRPMSLRPSARPPLAVQRVDVEPVLQVLDHRARRAGRVLDRRAAARTERLVGIQQIIASRSWATCGALCRPADHVAARDVEVVLEPDGHRHRRERLVHRAARASMPAIVRRQPARQHLHLVARAEHAAGHRCRRSRGSRGARRTAGGSRTAPGTASRRGCGRWPTCTCSRWCSSEGRRTRAMFADRVTTLSPCSAETG